MKTTLRLRSLSGAEMSRTKSQFITTVVCIMLLTPLFWRGTGGEALAARLVLNNNAYCVINKGAYLVIDTPSTSGIMTLGTGGNIISEADTNRVKWNIGTVATGTYIIPFSFTDGSKIPFTFNVTTAGTSSGNLTASTYYTDVTATPNNRVLPIGVTNLNNGGGAENDIYVADRFWRINMDNYTTNPTADIVFTYRDEEWNASGGSRNTITELNLQAQRWNGGSAWFSPVGTDNDVANTVTVTGISTSAPWTLVDNASPLPIELLWFKARWMDNSYTAAICEWRTSMEININYFNVQRSIDGKNFSTIINGVKANSPSMQIRDYKQLDRDPYVNGVSYYRLHIVDYDGNIAYSNIEALSVHFGLDIVNLYSNPTVDKMMVEVLSSENTAVHVYVDNILGQRVKTESNAVSIGKNTFTVDLTELSSGCYFLFVETESGMYRANKQFVKGEK